MTEKEIERWLHRKLDAGCGDRRILETVQIANSTSDACDLGDLVGERPYLAFYDNNDWNNQPKLMVEIAGNVVPDVVLRSKLSEENRIVVEIKVTKDLNYDVEDSQVVRYFLWLLGMTRKRLSDDIRRAVLLAAPSQWFDQEKTVRKWQHFLHTYSGIARAFDITLGEVRCDNLQG